LIYLIDFFDNWPPPLGPSTPKCARLRLPWGRGAALVRPKDRFLIIFGRFGTDPKNMFFSSGAKIDNIDE
jgi:hypothetical protein